MPPEGTPTVRATLRPCSRCVASSTLLLLLLLTADSVAKKDNGVNYYGVNGLEPIAAPAVPLVVNSPYLQVWSPRGNLTEHATVAGNAWGSNWVKELGGLIRVDGGTVRFLGISGAANVAVQTNLTIFPTRTVYTFAVAEKVRLVLTWTTAVLPKNLTVMSRPVTYVTFAVSSLDGKAHDVAVYFDATGQLVTLPANSCTHPPWPPGSSSANCRRPGPQPVDFDVQEGLGKMWMRGSTPISCSSAYVNASDECPDNSDWGQLYLATGSSAQVTAGPAAALRAAFAAGSQLPAPAAPPILATDLPAVAAVFNLSVSVSGSGSGAGSTTTQTLVLAYDTRVAVRWFGKDLLPLWTHYHPTAAAMARAALDEQASVRAAAEAFDMAEVAKYSQLGGAKFATLLSLAYRQTYASTELVWNAEADTHWMFLKEMSDNDLSTMDVIFPASPLFIYANPELAYSLLVPILEVSSNGTDPAPYCPHDLGTFPVATHNAMEAMPLEETANMLLMLTAIAQGRGKDVGFIAARFWPLLRTWVDYLVATAENPAMQACSDDFMGELAHNTNLALKGQLAIAAYGQLRAMAGDNDAAKNYTAIAQTYAAFFLKHADDGNHTRLAYDQPNTWSTKYNLIWDRILGLHLFPPELARKEVAFYSTQMEAFGLRLDERKDITKTDWFMWTGALDDSADGTYSTLVVDKVFAMLEADMSGVPANDCYNTTTGQAYWGDRACVGGFWAKVLAQP